MKKCYVKFYYDWIEQTAALSDAERGRLFVGILEYARSGQVMDSAGREGILFPVFQSVIDRDALNSAIKAENGSKGGKQKLANDSKSKQNVANDSKAKLTNNIRHKTEDKGHKTEDKGHKTEGDNPLIPLEGRSAELMAAVCDWLEYKRERRESYKPTGLKSFVSQVIKHADEYGDKAVAEVVRVSMSSNYQGVVFDRLRNKQPNRAEDNYSRMRRWADDS